VRCDFAGKMRLLAELKQWCRNRHWRKSFYVMNGILLIRRFT